MAFFICVGEKLLKIIRKQVNSSSIIPILDTLLQENLINALLYCTKTNKKKEIIICCSIYKQRVASEKITSWNSKISKSIIIDIAKVQRTISSLALTTRGLAAHSSFNSEIISVIYFTRDPALGIANVHTLAPLLSMASRSHLLVQIGELVIKQPCAETTESQIRREPGLARQ